MMYDVIVVIVADLKKYHLSHGFLPFYWLLTVTTIHQVQYNMYTQFLTIIFDKSHDLYQLFIVPTTSIVN